MKLKLFRPFSISQIPPRLKVGVSHEVSNKLQPRFYPWQRCISTFKWGGHTLESSRFSPAISPNLATFLAAPNVFLQWQVGTSKLKLSILPLLSINSNVRLSVTLWFALLVKNNSPSSPFQYLQWRKTMMLDGRTGSARPAWRSSKVILVWYFVRFSSSEGS